MKCGLEWKQKSPRMRPSLKEKRGGVNMTTCVVIGWTDKRFYLVVTIGHAGDQVVEEGTHERATGTLTKHGNVME